MAEQAVQFSINMLQRTLEKPGPPMERLSFLISKILENRQGFLEVFRLSTQNKKRPEVLDQLFIKQQEIFQNVLRQLIVEGQAAGEIVEGDPEQLMIAITASLDGLSKFALGNPEKFEKLFPDASIILRMLKP
ncbi:MAG: TetR family transcriptional regulator C-terminal domain-containing protein [Bacillota bacterium]|nr:TetR family transcriptional regulator C-terminal domain-containing protein [Bacillota bacterium]